MSIKRNPIFVIGPSICYLPLTRGQYALIEVDDAENVSRFNWFARWNTSNRMFYAVRHFKQVTCGLHRFLLGRPELQVDHVNGNGLDNRRCGNLRIATRSQNAHNRVINRNNKSGFKGVFWHKDSGKWAAKIRHNGRSYSLGRHSTPEAAAQAYREASLRLHGEFARLDTLIPPICPFDQPLETLLSDDDVLDDMEQV